MSAAFIASVLVMQAACEREPSGEVGADTPQLLPGGGSFLSCKNDQEKTFAATVGPEGASFSKHGVEVVVPAGALSEPTDFVVRVPASQYAEIDVTANGQEHFQFLKPVTMSLDYGRCERTLGLGLSVWHIDPVTGSLLENMGGVDDPLNKQIIFSTLHLSSYAIVN
jgi:hypothetical protein